MARKKRISMQKIADELGVSKVTVSKALNNKEGVSETLKSKIFRTSEKYGYILPDYGHRKSIKIAIIMNSRFTSSINLGKFYMEMYEKIVSELRKASCSSIMFTPANDTVDKDLETITKQELVDGIVLLGILDSSVREKVDAIPLPKIYVDIYDKSSRSDSVVSENIYSTYELTEYLLQMGHKEIGFVGTIGATTSITDRYLGYQRAMLEKRLTIRNEWLILDRSIDEGEAIDLKLPENMPTAFVCNCDETAFRLVRLLESKGYQVPEDVSIVSFDNDIYAKLCEPKLTTVAVNMEEIGKVAAKRMISHIKDPKKKAGEVYRVAGKNVFRDSVKKLNK